MLSPAQIVGVLSEVTFVFLGLLLVWVAFAGVVLFDPRSPYWLGLAAILIYWGLRAWMRSGQPVAGGWRRIRGGSLVLVGILMLGIAWAPLGYAGTLLGTAGAILVARGVAGALLLARARPSR